MKSLKPQRRLGYKLLGYILLFSSFITLLATAIQLYLDYQNDVELIEERIEQIRVSQLQNLANNLWDYDLEQIRVQLEGIVQLPDMHYLEVRNDEEILVQSGELIQESLIQRVYPLIYEGDNKKVQLGTLKVVASKIGIYNRIKEKVYVILATQAVKTYLVSLFILFIFQYLVTRHLNDLAKYFKELVIENPDSVFTLKRRPSHSTDELDIVVHSVNEMQLKLNNFYMELDAKNQALLKMDQLKDQFLTNTSHELRTPLHGIIGLAESLLDGSIGSLNDQALYNLSLIVSSGRRLSHLINDILDFSKLKNHEIELHKQPVDMLSLIKTVVSLTQPLIEEKAVELKYSVTNLEGPIQVDENRFQQILHNILSNAIKFTEKGTIEVIASGADNNLKVIVQDTGIGIEMENLNSIFDSFEQGNYQTVNGHMGTGLGLSISKKLVELHNGEISAASVLGEGTQIIINIPINPESEKRLNQTKVFRRTDELSYLPSSLPKPPEVQIATTKGLFTILIVDDELVERQVLKNYLSGENFNIITAIDGNEALALVESSKPDIILLDVMMPKMTGFEVCKILRKTYFPSELPIIFLSARIQLNDHMMGMSVGGNDYLDKPFYKYELLARLQNQIQLLVANRRLNSFLEFSRNIGEFKDAKMLIKTAFQQIEKNVYYNAGILFQENRVLYSCGDEQILKFLQDKEQLPYTDDFYPVSLQSDDLHGQLIHSHIKGFEAYSICLFRKQINRNFLKTDWQYIQNIVDEIHNIRVNISKLTHPTPSKEEIIKVQQVLRNITYIKSVSPFCEVHLEHNRGTFEIQVSMQEIELYFGSDHLFRVHRQYFVIPEKIDQVRKKTKDYEIILKDVSIPIGRTYLKKLQEKHSYLFSE